MDPSEIPGIDIRKQGVFCPNEPHPGLPRRTGVGKATLGAMIERVAVLVDGGHGRARTAPVAYKRVAVRGHVRAWRGSADKGTPW